jgi:hypothetical protein
VGVPLSIGSLDSRVECESLGDKLDALIEGIAGKFFLSQGNNSMAMEKLKTNYII